MQDSELEQGILRAFGLFIAMRFILWVILQYFPLRFINRPILETYNTQIDSVILLFDGLLLMILALPSGREKINKTTFSWLLIFSTITLLIGDIGLQVYRQEPIARVINQTPYNLFLATTIVFVAWQYNWRMVLIYVVTNINIRLLTAWQINTLSIEKVVIEIFVSLLLFALPGWVIGRMMNHQRQQQTALIEAEAEQTRINQQLVHYAASLEELTISRERNRLARELHDTLAHSLSAVIVQLGAVDTLWESNPNMAKTMLAQADESARQGLQESRRALQDLRATPLQDLGLWLAIQTLAEEAANRASTTLHVAWPQDNLTNLDTHISQAIYRIIQEALENIVRHAQAQHILVKFMQQENALQVQIHDDGCGFEVKPIVHEGRYGLAGMKERANVIGAQLLIESDIGNGTAVTLTIPQEHTT